MTVMVAFCACSSPEDKKVPEGIIPPEKIGDVLADVFLAESYVQHLHLSADSQKVLAQKYYEQVAYRHGMKVETLYKSMDYYLKHPRLLEDKLRNSIDSLSAMEAEVR